MITTFRRSYQDIAVTFPPLLVASVVVDYLHQSSTLD